MKKTNSSSFWLYVGGTVGVLLILMVLILMFGGAGYRPYKTDQYGFSMKYPHDWTMKENSEGTVVQFFSPKQNELDIFPENVNIVVQNLPPTMLDLDTYTDKAIRQLMAVFKTHVQMVETATVSLSGNKAYKIVYIGSGAGEGPDMKLMHIWSIVGYKAYQFTYAAQETQYDVFVGKAEAMARSFKIKE